MGKPLAIEKKQAIERAYVVEGVTSPTVLAQRFGTSTPTVRKIIQECELEKKRADFTATPEAFSDGVKQVAALILADIREICDAREIAKKTGKKDDALDIQYLGVADKVDSLEKIAKTLHRIDAMFYEKGAMIRFGNRFTDFAASQAVGSKDGKQFLKMLAKYMPIFIEYLEKELS